MYTLPNYYTRYETDIAFLTTIIYTLLASHTILISAIERRKEKKMKILITESHWTNNPLTELKDTNSPLASLA